VQDPASAEATEMPESAVRWRIADPVLPLEMIAKALISLAMLPSAPQLFRINRAA